MNMFRAKTTVPVDLAKATKTYSPAMRVMRSGADFFRERA